MPETDEPSEGKEEEKKRIEEEKKKTERQKRAWGRAELRRSAARVEARAPVCLLVCLFVFNSRDACLFFVITACKSRSYGSFFFFWIVPNLLLVRRLAVL